MINERYKLNKKLGKGRSTVYLCNDSDKLNAEFAIKILPSGVSKEEVDFFKNEFIALKYLTHPNIIHAFDFGTVLRNTNTQFEIFASSKFFTLEFFEGEELLSYKIKNEEDLRKIITQICAALYYLHQSRYIYYDLKPENILVKEINGEPVVKLIDLGLAERFDPNKKYEIKGTAEYIAPELLKKLPHDYRVDLYSLGMILYRMVYGKFPFNTEDELQIYKSQVEDQFTFEKSDYSDNLLNIIKRLLEKDAANRYKSVLEVLYDLNGKIESSLSIYWDSAPIFSDRKDFLNILNNYLSDQNSSEIFTVKGFEGSGKSALVDKLYYITNNAVVIKNDRATTGYNFLNKFVKNLIFDEAVFPKFSQEDLIKVDSFLSGESTNSMEDFKTIISKVARECKIVMIIDDFNLYDQLTLEFLREIIPILQVSKQKIILTENSDYDYKSSEIFNLKELNLNPFTEAQLVEFLEERFSDFFPKEALRKVIALYSDLLPGNVGEFIKDLLRLNIIHFNKDDVKIVTSDETAKILRSSHEEIYENRLRDLTEDEKNVAKILSFLDNKIDTELLAYLIDESVGDTRKVVESLGMNNILSQSGDNQFMQFTSEGLKSYIYNVTQNKENLHLEIANKIKLSGKTFDNKELSRQYELAGEFQESYNILLNESEEAERLSAFSYQKDILLHLLTLPLSDNQSFEVRANLATVYYKLGDFINSLKYIDEIIQSAKDNDKKLDLLILKGSCLIESGKKKEGKNLLEENLDRVLDTERKNQMLTEIAYAEFDLDNTKEAVEIARKMIDDENSSAQVKGKCCNLLGLIEVNKNGNYDSALENFSKGLAYYISSNSVVDASTQEMNLGNVYGSKTDLDQAKTHWFKAIEMNSQIGNLKNEALLLLNLGVQSIIASDYSVSAEYLNNALLKFESLNFHLGEGLTLVNLAEMYLFTCEYEESIELLKRAHIIFKNLENYEELSETILLMCHYYFQVGRLDKLSKLMEEYKKLDGFSGIHNQINIDLILIMQLYLACDYTTVIKKLLTTREKFSQTDYRLSYIICTRIFVNSCILLKDDKRAEEGLKSERYLELIEENPYLKSEYYYTLGLISELRNDEFEKSSIDYFNIALELIEELSITEITWKVLFKRGSSFYERGNTKKAMDDYNLAKTCLLHLSSKVDEENKSFYLEEKERKHALETIGAIVDN